MIEDDQKDGDGPEVVHPVNPVLLCCVWRLVGHCFSFLGIFKIDENLHSSGPMLLLTRELREGVG
jgi:hypothetical protein